jgi:hypothetical protein
VLLVTVIKRTKDWAGKSQIKRDMDLDQLTFSCLELCVKKNSNKLEKQHTGCKQMIFLYLLPESTKLTFSNKSSHMTRTLLKVS